MARGPGRGGGCGAWAGAARAPGRPAGLRGCGAAGRTGAAEGEGGAPGWWGALGLCKARAGGELKFWGSRCFGEPTIKGRTWGGCVHQGSLGGALLGPDLGEKLLKRAAKVVFSPVSGSTVFKCLKQTELT